MDSLRELRAYDLVDLSFTDERKRRTGWILWIETGLRGFEPRLGAPEAPVISNAVLKPGCLHHRPAILVVGTMGMRYRLFFISGIALSERQGWTQRGRRSIGAKVGNLKAVQCGYHDSFLPFFLNSV